MNRLIRAALCTFFLLAASPAFASSATETLASAEAAFAEGVELKHDAARARPAFARAAAAYDLLWQQGFHTADLAINRARAHRLAGNLPKCIAALHDGLAVARFSRSLQVELDDARAAVLYPLDSESVAQARAVPLRGISTRMSPADAWFMAGLLWLLTCLTAVRLVMTWNLRWLAAALACLMCLLTLGWLWLQDHRIRGATEAKPLLIAGEDEVLRKGNSMIYPPRLDATLPQGTEARELTRRGGWVQVQLSGGAIGWLPESSVITCGR